MKRNKTEAKKGVKIFSGIFFLAGLGILVMIGISLGKETYRKRQIQREIENLQSQIQQVNQENSDLANMISYFSTQEFQEKEAREKLNLQKDNEKMIILKKESESREIGTDAAKPVNSDAPEAKIPNWEKWLNFFFAMRS